MKNPFMSVFLSVANRAAGPAQGQAAMAVKRQAAQRAKQMINAWTNTILPPVAAQRRKKRPEK
jgi:hypothetical protein